MKNEFVRGSLYAYESKRRAMSGDSKADRRVNLEFEGKGILPPYGETDFMEEASEWSSHGCLAVDHPTSSLTSDIFCRTHVGHKQCATRNSGSLLAPHTSIGLFDKDGMNGHVRPRQTLCRGSSPRGLHASCPHETEWRSDMSRDSSDESTKDELCFTSANE